MRKLLTFAVAVGLLAATTVALASASRTAPRKAAATGESANAYLPKGVAPAANNWYASGGDIADTGYSQLKQINSSNIGGLKVAWNGSYSPAATNTGQFQMAPICCPDNLMFITQLTGMVAIKPGDGSLAWEYQGTKYDTSRSATTQHRPARTVSYSPKQDYIFAGQQDGSVVALKAKTGAPVWTAQTTGAGTYGSATGLISAPFTQYYDDGADGIVLSSPNGGESPFRGHLDAYNAKTGALVWRSWATPDPTQLPYILTWANPAEASQGGAALWGLGPAVNPELGLVYYATGNLYPWTGRQPGDNLWGTSVMAVDWKTGGLRWFYQTMKHDIWDLDCPAPVSTYNVPIDGKMTPVVSEGCKSGLMVVLNARNGAYLPHFNFTKIQTYDPTGRGKKLNGLSNTQWIPQGAAGCTNPLELSADALTKCRAIGGTPVAGSEKSGPAATSTGSATFFPADYMQISYGGNAPNPGQPGSYGVNVVGQNGTDPCPTCKLVNFANGRPIVGTSFAAGTTSDAYFAFGGTANGPYNFPHKAYSPLTHNMYACVRALGSGKGDAGTFSDGTESSNTTAVNGSTSDPRLFTAVVSAVNMTNNTFSWQYGSKVSTFGSCNAGTIATAGNLVFTGFAGRTDLTATQLFAQGILSGGALAAFDATTGKLVWQWGFPGVSLTSAPITYTFNGKQYLAIYHTMPTSTTLPGGAGHLDSDQREQMTVFAL